MCAFAVCCVLCVVWRVVVEGAAVARRREGKREKYLLVCDVCVCGCALCTVHCALYSVWLCAVCGVLWV